ncbi:hemin ABC transporter substrate-binding protein, partial [Burkholderia multivorans]|nr:hemin ABC transporter substrate-binding protein [Burkholderia multivorans]
MSARTFDPRRRAVLAGAAAGALAATAPARAIAAVQSAPKRVGVIGGALAETA